MLLETIQMFTMYGKIFRLFVIIIIMLMMIFDTINYTAVTIKFIQVSLLSHSRPLCLTPLLRTLQSDLETATLLTKPRMDGKYHVCFCFFCFLTFQECVVIVILIPYL